ncbi:MAG: hypothetical protein JW841_14895 [Deltaproteobacteria bacterium]|nr:hypothetical protein [Deltaproteobacteria bacterium]
MSNRIKWIQYRGKQVLKVDYQGLRGDELLDIMDKVPSFYSGHPLGSVLVLTDVRNTHADEKTMSAIKNLTKKTKPYEKKSAVIGITGIKGILLSAVKVFASHSIAPFSDEKEALDWLVS